MGRILALDVGDVRIGLACSDPLRIIANPMETYKRQGAERDLEYLCSVCRDKEVDLIICGLPKKLDDSDSIQTVKVRDFAEKLAVRSGIKLELFDERLTTAEAERVLIEADVKRQNRKQVIDKVAATIILQDYMESRRQRKSK